MIQFIKKKTLEYIIICIMIIYPCSGLGQRNTIMQNLPKPGYYRNKQGKEIKCSVSYDIHAYQMGTHNKYYLNCECEKTPDRSLILEYEFVETINGKSYNKYVCPQCSLVWWLEVDKKSGKHKDRPPFVRNAETVQKSSHKHVKECLKVDLSKDSLFISCKNACKAGKALYIVFKDEGTNSIINNGIGTLPSGYEVILVSQTKIDCLEKINITPIFGSDYKKMEENESLRTLLNGVSHGFYDWNKVLTTIKL